MSLKKYVGKKIKVICNEGEIIEGKCTGYTQDIDNVPEITSIDIENEETIKNNILYEIYENEIISIEIIKE